MKVAKLAAILFVALLVGCVTTALEWSSPEEEAASYLAEEIKEYQDFERAGGWPTRTEVRRLIEIPVIRIPPQNFGREEIGAIEEAVRILNAHLPATFQIPVSHDRKWWEKALVADIFDHDERMREMLRGNILVMFIPREEWPEGKGRDKVVAVALPAHAHPVDARHQYIGGFIVIDRLKAQEVKGANLTEIILHELLHMMGRRHPKSPWFRDSLMLHDRPVRGEYPYLRPIDIKVLQAVYGKG